VTKYYGIKKRIKRESIRFRYAKGLTRLRSRLPSKYKDYWKGVSNIFDEELYSYHSCNAIPENKYCKPAYIITSDLVRIEDVELLKRGLKKMLLKHSADDRFISSVVDLSEILANIDNMDSIQMEGFSWRNVGILDFRGNGLSDTIDHYSLSVRSVNPSFLSIECILYLTDKKVEELGALIAKDYNERVMHAKRHLARHKDGSTFYSYSVGRFDDSTIKANNINTFISCIQWGFNQEITRYLPLVLHKKGIIPPRIEVFYTDINPEDEQNRFWESIGCERINRFIIDNSLTLYQNDHYLGDSRFEDNLRLLCVVTDDGIEEGQLKSVKDQARVRLLDATGAFFHFMFLKILSTECGKTVAKYKKRLSTFGLKRNRLHSLLRLRYMFSKDINDFRLLYENYNWEQRFNDIEELYSTDSPNDESSENDEIILPYGDHYKSITHGAEHISSIINVVENDIEAKRQIMQNLSDYKNTSRSLHINIAMLMITVFTLFFVIFPDATIAVSAIIKQAIAFLRQIIWRIYG
jgi:hypothetical protein